jgi:hypothetical protein
MRTLQCQDVLRFMGKARLPQDPEGVKIDRAPRNGGQRTVIAVAAGSVSTGSIND